MSDMKTLIIKEMDKGKETLKEIEISRKNGLDYRIGSDNVDSIIDRYHPDSLELKVVEIIELNKDCKTFRLASTNGKLPVFQSGQYINIFAKIDGVLTSRPYSISSSNKETGYFDITIQRVENGFVSNFFLNKVKIANKFMAKGPAGNFYFNPIFHSKNSVFIAGGSGITPFISMTKEILYSGLDRNITLIYGCSDLNKILFLDELKDLETRFNNFKLHVVLSDNNNTDFDGLKGYINKDIIKQVINNDLNDYTYYICGPQVMNDFVEEELETLNVRKRNIKKEISSSGNMISKNPKYPKHLTGNETYTVTVNNDIKIKALASESLLTTLERANIEVKNVCCRSGECSLCRLKLVSGEVFMPKEVLLRHTDEKFSFIHSCQAFPISNLEIRF